MPLNFVGNVEGRDCFWNVNVSCATALQASGLEMSEGRTANRSVCQETLQSTSLRSGYVCRAAPTEFRKALTMPSMAGLRCSVSRITVIGTAAQTPTHQERCRVAAEMAPLGSTNASTGVVPCRLPSRLAPPRSSAKGRNPLWVDLHSCFRGRIAVFRHGTEWPNRFRSARAC